MPTSLPPSDFDEPTKLRMRAGYWLTGFGTGPDTVMLAVWSIGMIYTAQQDSYCSPFQGIPSGADGAQCTPDAAWDDPLWLAGGGAACAQASAFLADAKYVHDTKLPGCGEALTAYRAATPYTCNCTGDHSFTAIGWRGSNVVIISINIISAVVAVVGLVLGSYLDYTDKRLFVWKILYAIGTLSTLGMCVVFGGGVWIVGLVFCILTHIFTELITIPRSSYLNYVADDDPTRMMIGGKRQFSSFAAQFIFLAICLPITLVFGTTNPGLISVIVAALCALWYGVFMWLAFVRLKPVKATLQPDAGVSKLSSALSDVFVELPLIWRHHREMCKYFLFIGLATNGGPATILAVNTAYGLHMGLTGFELNILAAIVLLLGIPFAWLFAKLSASQRLKTPKCTLYLILVYFLIINTLVPLIVTKDFSRTLRIAFMYILGGVLASLALSWWYSVGWPIYVTMVPKAKVQLYSAYFAAVNIGLSWIGSVTYGAIVEGTNNHRLAWSTMVFFMVAACGLLFFIDFEKARKEAGNDDDEVTKTTASS